jgi:hypothetical protein
VEHIKVQHSECDSIGKPFRCALSGCDKSWKVSDEIGHDEMILIKILVDKWASIPFTNVSRATSF